MTAASAAATNQATGCQPTLTAMLASTGRKTSWPVAVLAVNTPMTTPRRSTNQRLTTVAARTSASVPLPSPTSRPQVSTSCQGVVMSDVAATLADSNASAAITTRRTPKYCISAAANGPISP